MISSLFTPAERVQLRADLLRHASTDARITGGAITGSAALDAEDRWSDIDLAFGVGDAANVQNVLADFTGLMYKEHGAAHHVDMARGTWIYRVFLLANTLQVDLAFTPAADFRPLAPSFRLMFGSANPAVQAPSSPPSDLIGMGWLYALHARSSIARGKFWQAEYMISGVRDHALALACIRHGLPAIYARGMDQLPREVTSRLEGSLIARLEAAELTRAFRAALDGLFAEIKAADQPLAGRLEATLKALGDCC